MEAPALANEAPALKSAEALPVEKLSAKERSDIFDVVASPIFPCPRFETCNPTVPVIPRYIDLEDRNLFTPGTFKAPTETLGNLGCFPMEIIDQIVSDADFESVIKLGQVNRLARRCVEMNLHYRLLINHAPFLFLNLVRGGLGARHNLLDLAATLHHDLCESCGTDYGPLVFLGNNTRCCYCCLWRNNNLAVTSNLTVPKTVRVRHILPNSTRLCPGTKPSAIPLWQLYELRHRLQTTVETPHLDRSDKSVLERPRYCLGCPTAQKQLSPLEAYWRWCPDSRTTGEEMRGHFHHPGRRFSKRMFLEHFKWCSEAQRLCEARKDELDKHLMDAADAEAEARDLEHARAKTGKCTCTLGTRV